MFEQKYVTIFNGVKRQEVIMEKENNGKFIPFYVILPKTREYEELNVKAEEYNLIAHIFILDTCLQGVPVIGWKNTEQETDCFIISHGLKHTFFNMMPVYPDKAFVLFHLQELTRNTLNETIFSRGGFVEMSIKEANSEVLRTNPLCFLPPKKGIESPSEYYLRLNNEKNLFDPDTICYDKWENLDDNLGRFANQWKYWAIIPSTFYNPALLAKNAGKIFLDFIFDKGSLVTEVPVIGVHSGDEIIVSHKIAQESGVHKNGSEGYARVHFLNHFQL